MPVIRKVQAKPVSKKQATPNAVQARINALLGKRKRANTPKESAIYLKRLKLIQSQYKKSGKKAA